MPKEFLLLLSAVIGAVIAALTAFVTTRATGKNQINIAKLNIDSALKLQQDNLLNQRRKEEILLERQDLKRLHLILSRISLENSQTMSYMQSDSKMELEVFRKRYLENCDRLHEAEAIAAMHYPEMIDSLKDIYSQSNIFWGHQEGVLRTDMIVNREGWNSNMSKVLESGHKIYKHVKELQYKLSMRAKKMKTMMSE